jgi:rhodanese-related sulfurtransferase
VAIPNSEDAVPRIRIEDAKTDFDAQTAIFIDVRGTDNYNLVHIPGALELSIDQYETGLADVDRDALIITYCT